MQATTVAQAHRAPLLASVSPGRRASIAAWTLGFAAPLYLAMRGGGYEAVLRDQVGIALWWIVLAGALVGVLPAARASRAQLTALGALVAFAAWTALGALWSQSSGRTVAELSRLSCYAALLALAIVSVRAATRGALLGGVACAIGVVTALALLSRLHPQWFPANETAAFLPGAQSRLNYPLNYWNGLAALVAIGAPLMAHFATSARRIASRMLSAAMLPTMAAVIYLTFSRGGWVELGAALLALLALSQRRLWRIATLATAGGGGALLIAAIHQRPAVDHGLLASAAGRQGGGELIVVALAVCAGVALLQGALALAERHVEAGRALPAKRNGVLGDGDLLGGLLGDRSLLSDKGGVPGSLLRRLPRGRATKAVVAVVLACALLGAFVAAGGPHRIAHAWSNFKSPQMHVAASQSSSEGRLLAVSGNGRYQMWSSALHAFEAHPLGGIGAGTFQYWWAAHGSIYSYVINAHSLYFETLGETGAIGVALLALLLGTAVAGALRRRWRASAYDDPAGAAAQVAVVGSLTAFLVAAGVDWVWQIPAIPVSVLLIAAAGMAGPAGRARYARLARLGATPEGSAIRATQRDRIGRGTTLADKATRALRTRVVWIALAALGTAAIAVPLASAVSLRSSQAQANAGGLKGALTRARTAQSWEPYAAEPALQQALVLEQARRFDAAAAQAEKATGAARDDWQAWLVRSRIEAERGDARAALNDWQRARSLDPRDPLFAGR